MTKRGRHEQSIDITYQEHRIRVRHLRDIDGHPFAFEYSITSPRNGEIQSAACYQCGETFAEFVAQRKRIVNQVIERPQDWIEGFYDDDGDDDFSIDPDQKAVRNGKPTE